MAKCGERNSFLGVILNFWCRVAEDLPNQWLIVFISYGTKLYIHFVKYIALLVLSRYQSCQQNRRTMEWRCFLQIISQQACCEVKLSYFIWPVYWLFMDRTVFERNPVVFCHMLMKVLVAHNTSMIQKRLLRSMSLVIGLCALTYCLSKPLIWLDAYMRCIWINTCQQS